MYDTLTPVTGQCVSGDPLDDFVSRDDPDEPAETPLSAALNLAKQRARPLPPAMPPVAEPPEALAVPPPQPPPQPQPPPALSRDHQQHAQELFAKAERQRARALAAAPPQPPSPIVGTRDPLSDFFGKRIPKVKLIAPLLAWCGYDRPQWVVLSQIVYWLSDKKAKQCIIHGETMRYCSQSTTELGAQVGLALRAVQVAMRRLRERAALIPAASGYTLQPDVQARPPYHVHDDTEFTVVPTAFLQRLGVDQAVCLASVGHWFAARLGKQPLAHIWRHGRLWLPKTHAELARETGLPERSVRAAIQKLVDQRLLAREHWLFAGAKTGHLRIDVDGTSAFFAAHSLAAASAQVGSPDPRTREGA